MKFTSLASSSRGNAYLVRTDGASPLLLEAGLPIKQLRDKLRDQEVLLSDLEACLISHEHGDHSKAVKDLLRAGVECWMSEGTARAIGAEDHHRIGLLLEAGPRVTLGSWTIIAFALEHDAVEPLGFFIGHGDERLLFVADTGYVKDRFSGITIAAIECNNISEIMSQNIQAGNIPAVVGRRVRRNHMSLENLIAMLKANDLSGCRTIYLMHLSDGNSDERRMVKEVQAATGIPTEALKTK